MDFKGPKTVGGPGRAAVGAGRSPSLCGAASGEERGHGAGARAVGERITTCGVPDGMLMDHGSPWWSARGGSMGATKLSLWLMKQGIHLHWSRCLLGRHEGRQRAQGVLVAADCVVD